MPVAEEWSRSLNQEYLIAKPFDWTFSTPYDGTLTGMHSFRRQNFCYAALYWFYLNVFFSPNIGDWDIKQTSDALDQHFIRSRDPILLFSNIDLFEDELGDNGISLLNVKIRVMPTGFFVLQRFFLRVDGSLLRVWDTRLQWRIDDQ